MDLAPLASKPVALAKRNASSTFSGLAPRIPNPQILPALTNCSIVPVNLLGIS